MTRRAPKVVGLTIYLIKEGTSEDEVFTDESLEETSVFPVVVNARRIGAIRVRQTPITPPSWAAFFAGSLESSVKFQRASVSAVFLTMSDDRLFALTFGQGRHFLRPEVIDDRFGLKVTLNSVDADKLRVVDATTSESNPMHSRRQSSRLADLGYFGLNLDQDILRAVTGVPLDESLGTLMSGIDGLTVRARITLKTLRPHLKRYLEKSKEKTYQERFSWVDQVTEVRDPLLKADLFASIESALSTGEGAHVWAAIPELVDWAAFDGFRIGARDSKQVEDITIDAMLEHLGGAAPSVEMLRSIYVYCMATDSPHPRDRWTFLGCIASEVERNGKTYVLNAETWYQVDDDFAKAVREEVAQIPTCEHTLPEWGDIGEAAYNIEVSEVSNGYLALMDRVMVRHKKMPSPIEFCDLLGTDDRIFHVKQYGQSGVLSHLFSQGLVSANCFLADPEFRLKLNTLLPDSHKFADPSKRPDPQKYEVVFAIGSSKLGKLKLPFFSQVTLRNVYRTLTQSLGFRASVLKIVRNRLTQTKKKSAGSKTSLAPNLRLPITPRQVPRVRRTS